MRENALYIKYDGISSQEFNIYKINFENGTMITENLIPSRTINYTSRQNSSISDFYSVSNSPLSFTVLLYVDKDITIANKASITRWLLKNTYKELIFETMPENVYYAIVESIDISHNTLAKGYFTVKFVCNAPWAFTKIYSSDEYIINGIEKIELRSNSTFNTKIVKVKIKALAAGNITITNFNNDSKLVFEGLTENTILEVDCYNHSLYAELNSTEILINDKKTDKSWLELVADNNNIQIEGNCQILIYWQSIKV